MSLNNFIPFCIAFIIITHAMPARFVRELAIRTIDLDSRKIAFRPYRDLTGLCCC